MAPRQLHQSPRTIWARAIEHPVAVESLLTPFPQIAQPLALGNSHPYLVALLTIDPEAARVSLNRRDGSDSVPSID